MDLQPFAEKLFQPPPFPAFDLPWPARMAGGLLKAIHDALMMFYFAGVKDCAMVALPLFVVALAVGFLAGALFFAKISGAMARRVAVILLVLSLARPSLAGDSEVANGPTHEGVEVNIDLPTPEVKDGGQRVRNFGAPRDHLGLCVFASMDMCARYHRITPLVGIINKIPEGGGWPEKVAKVVKEHAPGVSLIQYEGRDPAILDLAMRTGRAACVTYGYGDFYGGQTIAHMVLLVHLDSELACIIDNNDPLHCTWMTRAEFLKRWVHPQGQGWAYVFVVPPPPPVPHNG